MKSVVRPELPTAAVGSSQAPTATVEKSQRLEHKNSDRPQVPFKTVPTPEHCLARPPRM